MLQFYVVVFSLYSIHNTPMTNKNNFTTRGSDVFVERAENATISDHLIPGTYTVNFCEMKGYFLSMVSDFTLPSKVYGDGPTQTGRILNTFMHRPNSTGVHLDGIKGSGKTLLVKSICAEGRKRGIPTIIVNQPWCGDAFNTFIQTIDTDAILVFDEFEKVYNWEAQEKILTLFDGVYQSRKLFLLTTNNSYGVSEYLKNRPGRMYYSITYDVMDAKMVREVVEDQLLNRDHIESVIRYSQVFTFLNFDMLCAIIEEMNRYDETLVEVLSLLNVHPEMNTDERYDVTLHLSDAIPFHLETIESFDPNKWQTWYSEEVINDAIVENAKASPNHELHKAAIADSNQEDEFKVESGNLVKFDGKAGKFTYEVNFKNQSFHIVVTRATSKNAVFNFNAL